jgi:pimeloyl-ACP methyl ester carboxylesterase
MPELAPPASRFVRVRGLDLHYLDWGNAGAPAVVWIHGYTSSAQTFNIIARHFRDRVHSIAVDVRGHGDSAWAPDAAYQFSDQVADLAGFADHLALDRFTLVGTSMGGIIAMAYAGAHPSRLAGLVINDVGPDAEPGSLRITQSLGTRPESFASFEEALEYRRRSSPIVAARSLEDQRETALGVVGKRADGRWGWKMDPAYITQRIQHGAPKRPDLWPLLTRVTCPALVVWGMDSDVLSEAQARRMAEVLPHGDLVAVPGAGHPPTLMEPPALAALERLLSKSA